MDKEWMCLSKTSCICDMCKRFQFIKKKLKAAYYMKNGFLLTKFTHS